MEDVNEEKHTIDEKNKIKLGLDPSRNDMSQADLFSLPIEQIQSLARYFQRVAQGCGRSAKNAGRRVLLRRKARSTVSSAASGSAGWIRCARNWRMLKKALPPQYPFLQTIKDSKNPRDIRVAIRGDENNRGDVAPRHLPSILCEGEPKPFTKGSGRLELAEAIADPANPLTARVMVNRIWQHHFGRGIVETPSNFGKMGARPSNPELLDYLAARFVENSWSIKALHREIMLSAVYAVERGGHPEPTARRIRTTGCSGAPTGSAWTPRRCAIRCCSSPAIWILQAGGPPAAAR